MLHKTDEVSVALSSIHLERAIFLPLHLPGCSSLPSLSKAHGWKEIWKDRISFQWEAPAFKPTLLLLSLPL